MGNILKNRREHLLLQLSYVSHEKYLKYRILSNKQIGNILKNRHRYFLHQLPHVLNESYPKYRF